MVRFLGAPLGTVISVRASPGIEDGEDQGHPRLVMENRRRDGGRQVKPSTDGLEDSLYINGAYTCKSTGVRRSLG